MAEFLSVLSCRIGVAYTARNWLTSSVCHWLVGPITWLQTTLEPRCYFPKWSSLTGPTLLALGRIINHLLIQVLRESHEAKDMVELLPRRIELLLIIFLLPIEIQTSHPVKSFLPAAVAIASNHPTFNGRPTIDTRKSTSTLV